jgi:nucleoside-diphosphate-sugar epimerase
VNVTIVGGHGQVAMRLAKLLAERGDSPRGIIRQTDQADDLEAIGAEPIVLDIENREISDAVAGADAVVFAAGAGPGSGPARKRTVDYGGAVALVEAAQQHEIRRYVMVSAMGANRPIGFAPTTRPRPRRTSTSPKVASTTRSCGRAASATTPGPAGWRSPSASTGAAR